MKAKTRLVSLITLGALLGFMIAATSCTGLSPGNQAKLDQANAKYESATGISTTQTIGLMGKWWQDYQQAKELNALLKTDVIQATKASPVTSTKEVFDVRPVTSFVAPEAPPPASEPTEEAAPVRANPRRPDAHHRQQLASN